MPFVLTVICVSITLQAIAILGLMRHGEQSRRMIMKLDNNLHQGFKTIANVFPDRISYTTDNDVVH